MAGQQRARLALADGHTSGDPDGSHRDEGQSSVIDMHFFCQQMHSLLKHKMLQLTLKISLYMAPTCFGPSSGSIRWNLAKVTVFVEIISKNTSLKLLLCCGNICCVCWVLCGV
jgi:hypothetical protein